MVEATNEAAPQNGGDFEVPETVTPDFVRSLTGPTPQFLCSLTDNWARMQFKGFRIRDMISNITLVDVPIDEIEDEANISDQDDPTKRLIKYHFGPDFLHLQTVGLTMTFGIGPQPIQDLEMVERHYFRGRVIQDYGFRFGFVIPNSTNEWEFVYDMPEFTQEEMQEIIDAPWEVKSDSFFFAEGRLIIHNRAEYNYAPLISSVSERREPVEPGEPAHPESEDDELAEK